MGIVFDLKRFSVKDGPGIRTTVFLKGCQLRCVWCHNPESWNPALEMVGNESIGREMTTSEVMEEVLADRIFYEKSGGGMTLSGGEPMMQFDFARELLEIAKANGVHTALDTCGFAPWERLQDLLPLVDLFLYDFKVTNPEQHRTLTGVSNELILENLQKLNDAGARIFLRCPLVPGVNDDDEHLASIATWANQLDRIEEITLEPYHPLGVQKAERLHLDRILQRREFAPRKAMEHWKAFITSRTGKKVTIA